MKNSRSLQRSEIFFSNAIHVKGLKIVWKKVHWKSLSLRIRKNLCNLIFYGPNLLVWVTHGKFELEGWIQKLFIVKPRASVQCVQWVQGGVLCSYSMCSMCSVYCTVWSVQCDLYWVHCVYSVYSLFNV